MPTPVPPEPDDFDEYLEWTPEEEEEFIRILDKQQEENLPKE